MSTEPIRSFASPDRDERPVRPITHERVARIAMRYRSKRSATRSLVKSVELALATPAVIAHRTARMLAAGATPGAADRREFARMGHEKVQAFGEAYVAMAARAQRAQLEWWMAFAQAWWAPWMKPWWLGQSPQWLGARTRNALSRRASLSMLDVLARGLAPVHRTATANARRLGRRGPR